jgi:hypothetical protein
MSGSSRSGFTWKEVAEVLRVSPVTNAAIFETGNKRHRKERIVAKRGPGGIKDARRTSDQAGFRRPGASRKI